MQDNCISLPLDLPQLVVLDQCQQGDYWVVEVAFRLEEAQCPRCEHVTNKVHDRRVQLKRDTSLGPWPVLLKLRRRRFRCWYCGTVFTEADEVCGWRRRTTGRFRQYLWRQACQGNIKEIAREEGVSQDTVLRAWVEGTSQEVKSTQPLSYLGVDEFSVKRGQRYETIICDLERHRVVEMVAGRTTQSLRGYLEGLRDPEAVVGVVMDLCEAYRQAVEECLPYAKIVADKFHVLRWVGEALIQVQRRLVSKAKGETQQWLRNCRKLLFRNWERLTPRERKELGKVWQQWPELKVGWRLRWEMGRWYRQSDPPGARLELQAWEKSIREEGPPEFRRLLGTLDSWREEILNYFTLRLTNGFVEGKNNRVKAIQRAAYGYRNRSNLRRRILLTNVA